MTRKYLKSLIFVLFIDVKLYMLFIWCSQVFAVMWTNDSFARALHLELWLAEWAVNHEQKPDNKKRVKDLVR